jgi:hypothetical protein
LTDGVTVALQFLELSVQVRILVGQRKINPPDVVRGFFVFGMKENGDWEIGNLKEELPETVPVGALHSEVP